MPERARKAYAGRLTEQNDGQAHLKANRGRLDQPGTRQAFWKAKRNCQRRSDPRF